MCNSMHIMSNADWFERALPFEPKGLSSKAFRVSTRAGVRCGHCEKGFDRLLPASLSLNVGIS